MKKNRFYYSEAQKAAHRGSIYVEHVTYVWNGTEWVEYTEWCSGCDECKCNWDDAVLVFETDDFPQIKSNDEILNWKAADDLLGETVYPEEESKVKCSCCGKIIPKGADLYKVHGYTYYCCSAECLLDALVPSAYVKTCTGDYDD